MTVYNKKLHTTVYYWCVCIQKVLCHGAAFHTPLAHCPMIFCYYIEVIFVEKLLLFY